MLDFMRNRKKLMAFLNCIFVFLIVMNLQFKQSPYEWLVKESHQIGEENAPELLLASEGYTNKYILFFINKHGNISCAIIKKGFLNYKLLRVSSELLLVNNEEDCNFIFSSYEDGYTRKWIYWGILWNSEIDKVLLNKREARTIDIKNYKIRISYTVGEDCSGKLPPNQELIFR